MKNNIYAVIMAGGSGERFWPMSRKRIPKQLLPVISKKSMLQDTAARLKGLVPYNRIFIVTNKTQSKLVKKQLSLLPSKNIIVEPVSKNTAPCIAVSAKLISKMDKEAVMVMLPADHEIKDIKGFQKTIRNAVDIAYRNNVLVTLGISPRGPHTGYGYIKKGSRIAKSSFKVEKFTEKPNLRTAERYINCGNYLWNSGMFIWRADTILDEIKKYLPKLYNLCSKYNYDRVYRNTENISIDYGIMEKTTRSAVVEAGFDWDDVGSWSALDAHLSKDKNGNILDGNVVYKDIYNTTIKTDKPLIAAIGVRNLVIVADKDAILICPKNRSEEVKSIVGILKCNKKHKHHL